MQGFVGWLRVLLSRIVSYRMAQLEDVLERLFPGGFPPRRR